MKGKTRLWPTNQLPLFLFLLGAALSCAVLGEAQPEQGPTPPAQAQTEPGQELRGSLAGEQGAQELKRSLTNEVYNMHWGPVSLRAEVKLGTAYTDNVFLSDTNRLDDYIIYPQVNLTAAMPVGQLNMLQASVGLGYEWFAKNQSLNSDVPLVSPNSEFQFNVFVGDFRIKLYDKVSYEQTLVFNQQVADQSRYYNFSNVGRFDRFNNLAGLTVDWDLNKVIISAGYAHENFISTTPEFEYLNRASELITSDFNYLLGDRTKAGLEGVVSLNNYEQETVLNDNWRLHAGPFIQMRLPAGIILRTGGGYEMARFDSSAAPGNDYNHWYAYGKISQELKWLTHSVTVGQGTLLGDNANNLRTTYVQYAISSDAIKNFEMEGNFSVNFSKEFGGSYFEEFTQYVTGARVGWLFHKYFRLDVAYELFLKNSDTPGLSFYRDLVSVDVTFRF
jgi:hypothetical protein